MSDRQLECSECGAPDGRFCPCFYAKNFPAASAQSTANATPATGHTGTPGEGGGDSIIHADTACS